MPGSTLRILRPFGIALAGLLLVAMFAVIRFPYERFAPRLERLIAGALDGASVSIREIGPAFGLSGPVLEARSVVISGAIPREIRLQPLRLRPALSLRVFRGELALYVDARAEFGRAVGTVYLGSAPGFDGSIEDLDLGDGFFDDLLPLRISGTGDVEIDVALEPEGADGDLEWELHDGSVFHPAVPITIPFGELRGHVGMSQGAADLHDVELEGPALSARIQGTVANADAGGARALDLTVALSGVTATMRPTLGQFRVNTAADGTANLRIAGTTAAPVVR
ncbi:MAG: type II secretion system protein GspN [Deltaproteobacteria bacterium]|nr:MAG: type II secretion system protein GspN [Deltaproteobacteria bacterium]